MLFSVAKFVTLVASILDAVASPPQLTKRSGISQELYNDLVYYFQYAASAYSDICLFPNGNTLIEEFSAPTTFTQGFIARDDTHKEIVVAFRGTWSLGDVITDAELLLEAYTSPGVTPPANVSTHSSFLNTWNLVAQGAMSTISSQLTSHPGYALVATSHSLGGALSSLAAMSLKANFPNSAVHMYTYGQLRTGNDNYAYWVNEQFVDQAFRSTHTDDGIPTIIPMFLGYRHHGIEYWQNPDPATAANTVECTANAGEDPACSASIPSLGLDIAHTIYYGILAITPFCI